MMRIFTTIALSLLLTCVAVGQQNVIPGEYIVMLQPGVNVDDFVSSMDDANDVRVKQIGNSSVYKIKFGLNLKANNNNTLALLKLNPSVRIAQVNHRVELRNTAPNDNEYSTQWQYNNTGQNGGLPGADLDAELAWDITTGGLTPNGETIVVAIIDAGYEITHVDLVDNLWKNYGEIPNNGIDDDNNGYIDDYDGWNPATDSDNLGGSSHGTAVAGIVGAKGNNNLGVTGVNWNVKMMLLDYGTASEADVVEAYMYILNARKRYNETNGAEGAFVVATNSSFGLDGVPASEAPIWCAMYDSLGYVGIVSAVATTNNNSNVDVVGDIPSTCPSDYVIAVTNVNSNDQKVNSAGYGVEHVDMGAFGQGTYTTDNGNSYDGFGGTSGATPHVAGAIGLLYSAPGNLLPSLYTNDPANAALLTKDLVISGSEDNASLANNTAHGKRLNLFGVLQAYQDADTTEYCATPVILHQEITGDQSVLLSWESAADSHYVYFALNGGSMDSVLVNKSYELVDLPYCSSIDWYVRAICDTLKSTPSILQHINSDGCCKAPVQVAVDSVHAKSAFLSWSNPLLFDNAQIKWKIKGASMWLDSANTTSEQIQINDLDSCTNYDFQIAMFCDETNLSESFDGEFKTGNCPICLQDYCAVGSNSNAFEWIEKIIFSGWQAQTGQNVGYNFFGNEYGELVLSRGINTDFVYQIDASGGISNESLRLYVDLNQNKMFESEELIFQDSPSSNNDINGSFTLPVNTLLGSTRMRVVLEWAEDSEGCQSIDYGEIEDYCVTINLNTDGFTELDNNNFNIFPNPADNVVYIAGLNRETNYELYNAMGKLVLTGETNGSISILELPKGMYVLKLASYTSRIIKQ